MGFVVVVVACLPACLFVGSFAVDFFLFVCCCFCCLSVYWFCFCCLFIVVFAVCFGCFLVCFFIVVFVVCLFLFLVATCLAAVFFG